MTPEEKRVRQFAESLAEAERTADGVRLKRDEVIRGALAAGVSLRKVAELAGISHQRVAKIAQG